MTARNLFSLMQDAAAPVLEAYQSDLDVHDRRFLATIHPSALGLWAVRRMGTHITTIDANPGESPRDHLARLDRLRPYIGAITECMTNVHWYGFETYVDPTTGNLWEIDKLKALAMLDKQAEFARKRIIMGEAA